MLKRILLGLLFPSFTFIACFLLAFFLHKPVPRVHDEFSYLLMGDTLANGRVSSPPPPFPEFFESFHVLTEPMYASKYFPAQGIFLAVGQKLTGYPAVGVWLSSALACAAIIWMLQAWIGSGWARLGGFLMAVNYGIYSYWSQTYCGGMVPALGGALAFGAARRLWDKFSWKNSIWLGLGVTLLASSRPLEGFVVLLPLETAFVVRFFREKLWHRVGVLSQFALPLAVVLGPAAFLMLSYNRAITGSPWKTPYMLHEELYQETPQFTFLPLRPKITYSNPWLRYYFEVQEMRLYDQQRQLRGLVAGFSGRVASWWGFYCGIQLSVPLILPGLLRKGWVRYLQTAVLLGMILLSLFQTKSAVLFVVFDLLVFVQIALLWIVFHEFWPRIALIASATLILEALITKWYFPHYFAPAACLVLYLEVEGLRSVWNEAPEASRVNRALSPRKRRRGSRDSNPTLRSTPKLRGIVRAIPVICLISMILSVEGNVQGWKPGFYDTNRHILPLNDWSLRRAELQRWMEHQPTPQLVFVRYSPRHNVNYEWVYNHADIMHSHVIWARDLREHDLDLVKLLPDRTVWLLEADKGDPQLMPYPEVNGHTPPPVVAKTSSNDERDELDW